MSLLGLDVGTTGCKAIAFDIDGRILAQASYEYSIETPQPGWAEQDCENVWRLSIQALGDVVNQVRSSDPPKAMALSVQGEALIPVNQSGVALHRAILGMDTRTIKENEWLNVTIGGDALFQTTGMPLHTINTLPKLLWLKSNKPQLYQNTNQFLLYEDFFINRLTGSPVISHCLASRTQMYDLHKQDWSDEILSTCGLDVGRLAKLAPTNGGVVGQITKEIKDQLGLAHDVSVISGGHDQACAALGSGVIKPCKAMVSTGTAEVIEATMETPCLDQTIQNGGISVYRHTVPGLFVAMTLNHSGGLLLRWFRDEFCEPQIEAAKADGGDPYDLLLNGAPSGPTSLYVLPHFAGSGTPTLDVNSRGAILGLTFSDNRQTIAKAILEGLAFELNINIQLLKDCGITIDSLYAVGGGAKSNLWLQMKADITQTPIQVPKVTEAACLGAALLAGVGVGEYENFDEAVNQAVSVETEIMPDPDMAKRYTERFETYKDIYPALKKLSGL